MPTRFDSLTTSGIRKPLVLSLSKGEGLSKGERQLFQ